MERAERIAEHLVRVSDEGVAGDYRRAVVDATAELDGETLESVVTQVDDFDGTSRSSVQRLISDTGSDGIRLVDEVDPSAAGRAARNYAELDSTFSFVSFLADICQWIILPTLLSKKRSAISNRPHPTSFTRRGFAR